MIEGNVWQGGEHSPASPKFIEALGTSKQRTESANEFIARVDRESWAYVMSNESKLSWYEKLLRKFL